MAKLPVMGRVKTRLAGDIGFVDATRFYRHTLAAITSRLAGDRRWRTSLCISPGTAIAASSWPRHLSRTPQSAGDLGRRMQSIMNTAEPGPVIIVGTDIPAITPMVIARAFRSMRGQAAVFGPAPDGGYWLVGLPRSPRIEQPFKNVRWSSPATLSDSLAHFEQRPVALADRLNDVDDGSAYHGCRGWFGRRVLPAALKQKRPGSTRQYP